MSFMKDRMLWLNGYLNKRLYGVGKEDEYYAFVERWNQADTKGYLDRYKNVVYACVTSIAEKVAEYEPVLYKPRGDQLEELNDHEFLRLLSNPQPDEETGISKFQLFEATQSFIELTGESFWYMALGASGKPRAIYLMRPDKMGLKLSEEGNVNGYYLKRNGVPAVTFDTDEILFHKTFNPHTPYRGMSTVQAGLEYIDTEDHTQVFTKNFFVNNAGLNGVLTINGEVSKSAFKKFVRAWREKYEGVDNAGKTAIVRDTDASFEKVGLGLNELDMRALRDMTKEDIYMMFRIPKAILGVSDKEGLGRASVETFEYIFAKNVIEPKMKRLDFILQKAIRQYYDDEEIIVRHRNIIPEDKEFNLKAKESGVDKWLTPNEIRDIDGLDPLPGGDVLRRPINSIPIEEATAPEADQQDGSQKKLKVVLKDAKKDLEYSLEQKEQFRMELMKNQELYEREYKKSIKSTLVEQEKEALNNLEAKATSLNKAYTEPLFDISEANIRFLEKLLPTLFDLYGTQGALALIFAGDTESEFVITNAMRAIITNSTARMANNFNQETLEKLNASLAEGVSAGESLGKLKKRVGAVYGDVRGYRLERIARTETLKASNVATQFAYKQTGYVKSKEWVVNPGACEFCRALEGKTIRLDENFLDIGQTLEGDEGGDYMIDYESITNPPVHPNCRCTIIPVRE